MSRRILPVLILILLIGVMGWGWLQGDGEGERLAALPATAAESSGRSEEKGAAGGEVILGSSATAGSGGDQGLIRVLAPLPLKPEEEALLASLRPRRVPPKAALHVPAGEDLSLTVKWQDSLQARPNATGQLILRTADTIDVGAMTAVLQRHGQVSFYWAHSVTDAALSDLQKRAAERSGEGQPDLAGQVGVRLAGAGREQMVALALELHALAEVEYAELESLDAPPPPPAVDIPPVTPLLVAQQTYRQAAQGVNVDYVWQRYGVRGDASLRVTDCEYDYNPLHEDLANFVTEQANVSSRYTAFGSNHGTAVLGILASGWNGYGTTGSVPDCQNWFYPEFSQLTTGFQGRTACVTAAIADSIAGDIVILEMQTDGPAAGTTDYVPAEYTLGVWNAVRTGSNAGVITIAAAGNGNQNLNDAGLFAAYQARGDSGAIIVGAGNAARTKSSFSTYGTRVNVQGWGSGVFTTGYGSYAQYGGDANQSYTSTFNGTSSATPVVASAAALVQAVAIKILGFRLGPDEMRDLLVATGRAQTGTGASSTPIGPLPEAQQAVEALLDQYPPTFATYSSWGHFHFALPDPDPLADEDDDGWPNLLEYVLGTNPHEEAPTDAEKLPRVQLEWSGEGEPQMVFEFFQPAARVGAEWVVQYSTSLEEGDWENLTDQIGGVVMARTGDAVRVTRPHDANESAGFFRLHVALPE